MGDAPAESSSPTIYFGFGSNLWLEQMRQRCPTSTYEGIARLRHYRWIINSRGYANVVELPRDDSTGGDEEQGRQTQKSHCYENEVWGLVYYLKREDESKLDVNEGVPHCYTKEYLTIDFWPRKGGGETIDVAHKKPEQLDMLVYIDRKRTKPDTPKKEYVFRMNKGIHDAVKEGVPEEYVSEVMRKFIPEVDEEGVEEVARKQALKFEDER